MGENKTYDEIEVGDEAIVNRVCASKDLYIFAHASGNLNPLHNPSFDIDNDGVSDAVAPSMWVASLISAVLGNILPGPGTLYRRQDMRFLNRAHVGDTLSVGVRVTQKGEDNAVTFETWVDRNDGMPVLRGEAEVSAPTAKLTTDLELPEILVEQHKHFDRLLEACEGLPPLEVAVACPDDPNSLGGVVLAVEHNLIAPVIVGCRSRIADAANEIGKDISHLPLIDIEDEPEAAAKTVELVHQGKARALMKGHLHTDDLLRHVMKRDGGLRTGRRITHVFVMDVPGQDQMLMVSDAAINIAPDLETKVDIVQNAINLGQAIGMAAPRVGILSAVETVNPKIPSTLDAAVLSKMAERGQITGGIVDGPLAMDNAMDVEAARTKGITSLVAGHAEVLIVPNLEAGNMLAKELTFIAHAEAAGLVVGARVPVILTSRADNAKARLVSCALAILYDHWRRTGESLVKNPDLKEAAE
ncbi:MAG: bifunctional enoyl-CoA hydratase/phosphate acetyltransferase [Hyphomicrobiales bacterium]|nr:bifunctional enoyl-CoA hydratase/phosphate acetyltransferase [Hyphomicrobiales bacterium]